MTGDEGFGRLIPDWGRKDLWLLEVGAGVDGNEIDRPAGYLFVGRVGADFTPAP